MLIKLSCQKAGKRFFFSIRNVDFRLNACMRNTINEFGFSSNIVFISQHEISNLRFRKDVVKNALRSSLRSLRTSLHFRKERLYALSRMVR